MKTTINYGLKKPEGSDVVNIEDLNYNADVVDKKIKEVENKANNITVPVTSVNSKTGEVILNAGDIKATDGKTLEQFKTEATTHLADMTQQIENIDLSADKVTLDSTVLNSKDVKAGLEELFTFADNGKRNWVDVIGSPLSAEDDFSTLKSKTQTLKNTMASNLSSKVQSASGTEGLNSLIDKIRQIDTSNIKNIQRGLVNIHSFTKSPIQVNINSADVSKSILRINYFTENTFSGYASDVIYYCRFIDSTTIEIGVTFRENISPSFNYYMSWEVIEFSQGEVQSGVLTNVDGSTSSPYVVNINTINPNKTLLLIYVANDSNRSKQAYVFPRYNIKNSTSFEIVLSNHTDYGNRVYWQLIDLS